MVRIHNAIVDDATSPETIAATKLRGHPADEEQNENWLQRWRRLRDIERESSAAESEQGETQPTATIQVECLKEQ